MMRATAILSAGLLLTGHAAATDVKIYPDLRGDAVIRRTDVGMTGAIHPAGTIPDVVRITLSGWFSPTAYENPLNGWPIDGEEAEIVRLDVSFAGVVNPPGPNDPGNFNPYQFGPSPVYGSVEFNVDRDEDTGGEHTPQAKHRYFANVGRFGRMHHRSFAEHRGVRWGVEIDDDFGTAPQFERDGTDFLFSLCGCWTPALLSETGNGNGTFEAGESWRVRGRFFQRAGGYRLSSYVIGPPGSSAPGQYDPDMTAWWSHNTITDETTVTLFYPLSMLGASQLLSPPGTPPQSPNPSAADHYSLFEGMWDVRLAAQNLPLSPPTSFFASGWAWRTDEQLADYQDPTRWRVQAIFGTSYVAPIDGARYVWTDTGGEDVHGDVSYDELVNSQDRLIVRASIPQWDGSTRDCDGVVNGTVVLCNPGPNFCAYDVDMNHRIDFRDSVWYCRADANDDLVLNVADFTAYLSLYAGGDPIADVNGDGRVNIADFTAFLQRYAAGCP